ncbi:YhgE/Pip family protein [Kitasatospora sp. A2-31]|uniref:YhgE/Pip family protein n=1 Tax=Kitasatospora sp. A2-31 TaxID=2916414 RepID=UPI001EEC6A36|nr:YhgE/Pip domain-containing protein [Kitasatospora sp. A2-31]MCG6498258.1 YhgE/Pip domain-containing protein [Kitasatospora sp. A2-31]
MTAIRLAVLELRSFRGPLRRFVPLVLCLVPLLYGAMYLWANWDPYGKTGHIPVAVVDEDLPAQTRQGQQVDAGAQVVTELKASREFDWAFVDEATARTGLERGRYSFTVHIPADFSARLATGPDAQPEQARIHIRLNDANNYIAGVMTEVVQAKLQEQVNAAAHGAYVRGVYGRLADVSGKLDTAARAAQGLVNATTVAQQGSSAAVGAGATLQAGSAQLADGARKLSQATSQVHAAAAALDEAAPQLDSATGTLVGAAALVSQGVDAVHIATSTVKEGTAKAAAGLDRLAQAHPGLSDDPLFQRVRQDASAADTTAGQIEGQAATAGGNARAALQQAANLQKAVAAAQQSARNARTPLALVDSGAQSIAAGTSTVSTGLSALQQGSGALKTAADQANTGATTLANLIDDGRKQVPVLDAGQLSHASQVLGTPVEIDRSNLHPAGVYGRGLAPFFFGVALWVFGLFAYLFLRPVNTRALAARTRASTLAVAGWLPAAALGALGALILYGVVSAGLGLHAVAPWKTVLLLLVGAAAFVAIDHCLRTAFGTAGDVLSLILLILQLTASGGLYPMQTTPAPFQAVHAFLPMTYLVDGLRVTISGGLASHLTRDIALLVGFGVLFLCLTSLVLRRRRVWTVARLHPDLEL